MFKKIFSKKESSFAGLNPRLTISLFAVVLLGIIGSIAIFFVINADLRAKVVATEEANRPAKLTITIIEDKNCDDCFNMDLLIETITKENIEIVSNNRLDLSSSESRELINKYDIKSVPSAVISGELSKNTTVSKFLTQIGEIKDDIFVMRNTPPPYVDVATGEIKGKIKLTMITDRNCSECYDVTMHEDILTNFGASSFESELVEIGFDGGKEMIDKYDINLLPTIVLEGELEYYPSLKKIWEQIGTIESDGAYVFREGVKQMGVYKDLALDTIVRPEVKKTQ